VEHREDVEPRDRLGVLVLREAFLELDLRRLGVVELDEGTAEEGRRRLVLVVVGLLERLERRLVRPSSQRATPFLVAFRALLVSSLSASSSSARVLPSFASADSRKRR